MKRRLIILALAAGVIAIVYLAVSGTGADDTAPTVCNHPTLKEIQSSRDLSDVKRLSVNARSVLVADNNTGAWLYSKEPQQQQPIASLTKLLTALVYLDLDPNFDTVVYITSWDCYNSSRSRLREGEAYRAGDLLYVMLLASDNRAARAVATASGLSSDEFIARMNAKARELGMMNTLVYEVTGLDERNVSTAADMAILIKAAAKHPLISAISSTYKYRIRVQNRKVYKNLVNTNRLVMSAWRVLAGKTGYILESGYCLATVLKSDAGQETTIIVLGSPTNGTRFSVARKLAEFGFKYAGRKSHGARQIAGR